MKIIRNTSKKTLNFGGSVNDLYLIYFCKKDNTIGCSLIVNVAFILYFHLYISIDVSF